MKRLLNFGFVLGCALTTLVFSGCNDRKSSAQPSAGAKPTGKHAHQHPSTGPHGGPLVELGSEDYHAELVHNETDGTVTIYLLDGSASKPVAIAATEVTINLKHEGDAHQFKLPASADQADPAGHASRFVSSDKDLGAKLDSEGSDAQLVIVIDGKQYRGLIKHHHDHTGHKH